MGIKIVDFMHNPDEFGPALLDVFKCCFYDIADKIQLNPFLGEYTTPERKIITCTSDDFKRMARLVGLNPNWFFNHYYQAAKFGKTFVALHNKNIVGGTNVQIQRGRNEKIAFMSQLYVHPSFQGQKIGYTLFKTREKYAKKVLDLNIAEGKILV